MCRATCTIDFGDQCALATLRGQHRENTSYRRLPYPALANNDEQTSIEERRPQRLHRGDPST
jgi:hypothetical protein